MRTVSMSELVMGEKYQIVKFAEVGTKFGPAVVCTLNDGDNGHIDVFIPKMITTSADEIKSYNQPINGRWKNESYPTPDIQRETICRVFNVEFSK
jgi:hypothetical protein